ncbi:MAG: MopE-related protein [Myxococcota bacterium]
MMWRLALAWALTACSDGIGTPQSVDFDNDGINAGVDCDDSNPAVYPGATEICDDGVDNDCDGVIDDQGIGATTWYADADRDGFGDPKMTQFACAAAVDKTWVDQGGDCDDNDEKAYPGAPEVCDNTDQNCNGQVDEGLPFQDYWEDADDDGFGDANGVAERRCAPEGGLVTNNDDCDDAEPAIFPGAIDICDGIDNDCDLTVDGEGRASIGQTIYDQLDDAIDATAGIANPGVIRVCAGYETVGRAHELESGQTLIIEGPVGVPHSIIVQAPEPWLTMVSGSTLELRGLELTSGNNNLMVDVASDSTVRVSDVAFQTFAAAFATTEPSNMTTTLEFDNIQVESTATFLDVSGEVDVTVTNSTFDNNTSTDAGRSLINLAASQLQAPSLTTMNVVFTNNMHVGSVVRLSGGDGPVLTASFDNTQFIDNMSPQSGVIFATETQITGTNGVEIRGTRDATRGGGLYLSNSTVSGVTIDDCEASQGAAVFAIDSTVEDITMNNNRASAVGGGIYIQGSGIVRRATVTDNTATSLGGGIYAAGTTANYATLVEDSRIENNEARLGGGLYHVAIASGLMTLTDSTQVYANTSTDNLGPGFYIDSGSVQSEADFGAEGTANDNPDYDVAYVLNQGANGNPDEVEDFDVDTEGFSIDNGTYAPFP